MVAKAASRGADAVILDLEDGVHPASRPAARAALPEACEVSAGLGAPVAVRVSPAGTSDRARDLEAVAHAAPDAALLAKAETEEEIREARAALGDGIRVWLMIETARGAAEVFRLARTPGVSGLVFGSADFRLSIGGSGLPGERDLDFVRSRLVLAARAAGVAVWDAPWFAFRDLDGLRRSARRAFALGFDGKSAVHPMQIEPIHRAFAPSPEQRAWAERVVQAVEAAERRGESVVELDGQLVEALHRREALRLLRLASSTPRAGVSPSSP